MLVAVSDLHLGSGKNLGSNRHEDILNSLRQAVDYACKKQVKYFVLLGDNFDYPNPSNFLRGEFLHPLCRLASHGIKIFVLTGNHEFANQCNPFQGFAKLNLKDIHIIDKTQRLLAGNIEFIFLPHNKEIDSKTTTWKEIFQRFKIPQGKKRIVLGHFPVVGSKVGPSDFVMSSQVEKNELKKLHADLILLGDIHKPQKLFDKCYYVGSIDRINFGEQDEKKRFIHVTKKMKVKSIEVENRRLVTFIVGEDKYKIVKDAIVKPIISCNEVDINKFNTIKIIGNLENANANFIMPIVWNIEPRERRKKSKKGGDKIDKKKYLKKFLKRNYPKANVDRLMKIYETVKTKS